MPIIEGHTGRKIVLRAGGRLVDAWIWPKALDDECAVMVAKEQAETPSVAYAMSAATYLARMVRKADGRPMWQDAAAVLASVTGDELDDNWKVVLEVDKTTAEEMALGNPLPTTSPSTSTPSPSSSE